MSLPEEATLLMMTVIGVPLYSARGLTQTLTMDTAAKPTPRRTTNGAARFLGGSQMRKYVSQISCTDQSAPAFDGLWAGDTIVVDCVVPLSYPDGGTAGRSLVPGTSAWKTKNHWQYYPRITFMVTDWEDAFEEYGVQHQWRLSLMEV